MKNIALAILAVGFMWATLEIADEGGSEYAKLVTLFISLAAAIATFVI